LPSDSLEKVISEQNISPTSQRSLNNEVPTALLKDGKGGESSVTQAQAGVLVHRRASPTGMTHPKIAEIFASLTQESSVQKMNTIDAVSNKD